MMEKITPLVTLLPILTLLVVVMFRNRNNINTLIRVGSIMLVSSMFISLVMFTLLYSNSELHSLILDTAILGELLRFDTLSTTMYLMVSIIGWVVLRFSKTYLQGELNQASFIRKLLTTIAFVQLLVLSGNLYTLLFSWFATSISLQGLIGYYSNRKEARQAVKKKFPVARMSDFALLIAVVLLHVEFSSVELTTIFQGLKNIEPNQVSFTLELAGIFLVLAAIIKSVQLPFHGWILDVMESPTPVSGLLHAGLLNAGPFLIIRCAHLLEITSIAPVLLLLIGGISALYGTIVFPTQPAIKTSLAYSSIGHMGFSLMMCGMGFYSAALLHLVAHSFYKAHAFLSSGSTIDRYRLNQISIRPTHINIWQLLAGILTVGGLYYFVMVFYGSQQHNSFQLMILGTIIIAGVSCFMARTTTVKNGFSTIIKGIVMSGFVLVAFFTLESTIGIFIADQIPSLTSPNTLIKGISLSLMILFIGTIFYSVFSGLNEREALSKWQVYQRNGFYIHVIFDRFLSSIYPNKK